MSYVGYNFGSSNKRIYDNCAYQKQLTESQSPLLYRTYQGMFENCNKCLFDNYFVKPYDSQIVDRESELKNITRPSSKCSQFMYNPTCPKSGLCTSTYDLSNPKVLSPDLCPIVTNNLPTFESARFHKKPTQKNQMIRNQVPRGILSRQ